jgi:hypothetical protein
MIDGSTVPMLVREDDKLMVVSSVALVGLLLESCSCTKIQLYVLLSANTLVGPMYILSLVASTVTEQTSFTIVTENNIVKIIVMVISSFFNFLTDLLCCFSFSSC